MSTRKVPIMKIYLALLLSIIVISCNSKRDINYGNNSISSLYNLEKELYSNPSIVLDSLLVFNKTVSSNKVSAYSNLLYAIAYEQKFGVFINDSIIDKAVKEFKQNGDQYNYNRAVLYSAIADYSNKKIDSLAYYNITAAENFFKDYTPIDYNLSATLYLYLGRYHRSYSNRKMAEQSLIKSLEYSKNATKKNSMLCAKLELFNLKLIDQKYGEALNIISCFGDETQLPSYIEYNLYYSMYNYYTAKKDYKIALEYLKKILQINSQEMGININNSKTYHQLAFMYKKMELNDSSLYYSKAAVQAIKDSFAQDSHFYYRYLADILYGNKQYMQAANLYRRAHLSYIASFTKLSQQRELEIKAKYNFEEQEKEKNSIKVQRALVLNILFILAALLVLISLSYFFNARKNNLIIARLTKELDNLDHNYKKSWLISEIYKTSSFILPQFINNVCQEAARSRKVSKETFESLNNHIDIANTATRASVADITNSEKFIQVFGSTYNIDSLTDFEKLVYALNEEGYSNLEIANFLNSSQSSIRTIKSKILRKMQKTTTENDTEN